MILQKPSLILVLSIVVVSWPAGVAAQARPSRVAPEDGKPIPVYDARTFFETVTNAGGDISADERKILFTSDRSGVFNVYSLPVSGGEPTPLTKSTKSAMMGISWFPGDDRVLVTADREGNELNHVYVREEDGTLTDLTPGENLKAKFLGFREDDRAFFLQTNERDPRFFDVYRYDIAIPGEKIYPREMVFRNDEGFFVTAVSRDGRYLGMVKPRNNLDSDVYVQDTKKPEAKPRHLTPHEGSIQHGVATFSPDSGSIYVTSDEGSEWRRVWSYDLESDRRRLAAEADWDIQGFAFSPDGRYRFVVTNEDARIVLSVTDTKTGKPLELPPVRGGEITGAVPSDSGELFTLLVSSDTSPTNLWSWKKGEKPRRLTESLNPKIDESVLVQSEVVRYASFDGLAIPAILWKPRVAERGRRVPAVVWVHGGPGGQSRTGYRADIQYLANANHGYAVLAVNNRGSSGYGKTFFHLDDRRHGDVDLKDCVWARKYLESLPWIDGDRIAIMGGSYGGYMVAAALAFTPEAFDAGIDIFGVTNWLRTLENIPPWWEAQREALYSEMGDPATDKERLHAISPLFHADRIQSPLLVVQGANDPRVIQVESDELVEAARKNGTPVEYVVFEDEGHGFRKRENRIEAAERYVAFLDEHLKKAKP